jgi:RNA polymerase sigma factor (sigma-70 family)
MSPTSAWLRHGRGLAGVDEVRDAELLGMWVACRQEEAFAALVERHGGMVYRVCRSIVGDAHAAEDAAQAVFLVLARKAHAVRPASAVAAWLHGVARRVALKARATKLDPPVAERGCAEEPAAPRADPLEELTTRELLALLDEEVARLPRAYRLPVVLCCLEGRSQEEAAKVLGWSAGSVRGRLARGGSGFRRGWRAAG